MNTKRFIYAGKAGCVVLGLLLSVAAGCVRTRHAAVVVHPAPAVVIVQDDYVYYPGYQVYYSNTRRQYIYREGRTWVTRPAPPRVSVNVLVASPSVRVDFHDAPSAHHDRIVKQYPKHWAPPRSAPGPGPGRRDDGRGNDRGERK